MNVWYILCKMKEAFLGKKTVSNQRSLAQELPRISSGYSAVHSSSEENGGGEEP
jgi:hypothetical protein